MKKILSLLLCMALLFACAACAQPQPAPAEPTPAESGAVAIYNAGTYTSTVRGRNADIVVEVTFEDERIAAVNVLSHEETAGIGDIPIERIPTQVVEYQSLKVDTVTAATITSEAIIQAIKDCVEKAGGDVAALLAVNIQKQAGELITKTADVLILGGGGAGLSAATAASENGASVIVVEKTAALGGNTKLALGLMNAADPERQAQLKMTDALMATVQGYINMESHDSHMKAWQETLKSQLDEYLQSGSEALFDSPEFHMIQTYVDGDYFGNPVLIEKMCSEALNSVHWLSDHGLKWPDVTKTAQGVLWQRAHQATEYKSGLAYIETFTSSIEKGSLPVEIVYEVRATELIMQDGRVVGAKGKGVDGTPYEFYGEKGVILTTGGFGANVEMREEYNSVWPTLGAQVSTSNSPAITGDGILMAQAVGANLVGMDKIQLLPVADPSTGETNTRIGNGTSPYINKNGERFVAEDARRDVMAAAILRQPDSVCWLISSQKNSELDENMLNAYGLSRDYLLDTGKAYMADTLEELAVKIGLDPDTLVDVINKFNDSFDKGYDEEFGRKVFDPNSRIDDAPYYACLRAPAIHHTMGGVEIDSTTKVYGADGKAIPGLYAAGEVTGGIHGGNRLGGNAITDAITFGRIAGETVTGN